MPKTRNIYREILDNSYSSEDVKVLYISSIYNKFCKKYFPNVFGMRYVSLNPKNPKGSCNWIHFVRCRDFIEKLNIPAYGFIKSQFIYSNNRVVYPNMLYSTYAKKKFLRYLKDIENVYTKDEKRKKILVLGTNDIDWDMIKESCYLVKTVARKNNLTEREVGEQLKDYISHIYFLYIQGELGDKSIIKRIEEICEDI